MNDVTLSPPLLSPQPAGRNKAKGLDLQIHRACWRTLSELPKECRDLRLCLRMENPLPPSDETRRRVKEVKPIPRDSQKEERVWVHFLRLAAAWE